jgi:hypothetical protein
MRGDFDLGGDDDDVAADDKDDTSPHAKGVSVMMTMLNSPRWQPQSSKICPLLEKKRTFASAAVSENYIKIRVQVFP